MTKGENELRRRRVKRGENEEERVKRGENEEERE